MNGRKSYNFERELLCYASLSPGASLKYKGSDGLWIMVRYWQDMNKIKL